MRERESWKLVVHVILLLRVDTLSRCSKKIGVRKKWETEEVENWLFVRFYYWE